MRPILDADLAATIFPTEQLSQRQTCPIKELECPFNVRCQMHGQSRGAGREYDLSNHGPSLKSARWQCVCQTQGCGGENDRKRHVILCHQG
jgi:hypothetical protein